MDRTAEKAEVVDAQPEQKPVESTSKQPEQQLVVADQPKETKAMTLRGGRKRWKKDLCHCSGTCCCAMCCAPCILQKNRNRYKKVVERDDDDSDYDYDDDDDETFCDFWGCWCCCQYIMQGTHFHWVLPCLNRRDVRRQLEISGSGCGDFCATYFCLCCTLSQEAHELKVELGYISE